MIGFEPVMVPIGPWALRAFGVLTLIGLGVAIAWTVRAASHHGIRTAPIASALVWAIPVSVLGARAVHVLGWWDYYLMHGSELGQLSPDGLALWGGLACGTFAAWIALRGNPAARRVLFNIAAPGIALGIAIGRLGEFLDGYGQGIPSTLPWATRYASRLMASPDFGVARHPVQVYDGLVALVLFVALTRLPLHRRGLAFLAAYATATLALAPLRLEPAFLFGLQIDQMLAATALVFALASSTRRLKLKSVWRTRAHEADPVLET